VIRKPWACPNCGEAFEVICDYNPVTGTLYPCPDDPCPSCENFSGEAEVPMKPEVDREQPIAAHPNRGNP